MSVSRKTTRIVTEVNNLQPVTEIPRKLCKAQFIETLVFVLGLFQNFCDWL